MAITIVIAIIWFTISIASAQYNPTPYSDTGKFCIESRLGFNLNPKTEAACKANCIGVNKTYAMWDRVRLDGFCMCSDKCSASKMMMGGGDRRYNVWKTSFVMILDDGRFCLGANLNTYVGGAKDASTCLEWCRTLGNPTGRFCMYDKKRRDGFCIASHNCDTQVFAGDDRRYTIWQDLDKKSTMSSQN